jgi:hypothetical protein
VNRNEEATKMGHWEQIAAERLRAPPVPLWRKLGAGLLIAAGVVVIYGLILLKLWAMISAYWAT